MEKKNNLYNLYKIVWIFIIIILIHSCSSRNQEIVRDESGNIVLKCELKNGVRDGKCFEYYPNGSVKGIYSWVAGIWDGEAIEYFENGNVKSIGMWKDGKEDGEFVWYYENGVIESKMFFVKGQGRKHYLYDEEGNLQKINYFIFINGKPQLNKWIIYNTKDANNYPNNVNFQETKYAHISTDRDTIDFGSFAEYEVEWMSDCQYYYAVTGNFDHNFNVIDSTSIKRVNLDDKNRFYPTNLGTDTLRVIFEFIKFEDGESLSFETYLEEVFTVIEK